MSKKKKNKYYAIKRGRDVNNKIVRTCDECSKIVLGYHSEYKSFTTLKEAEEYLGIKEEMFSIEIDKDLYEQFKVKCRRLDMREDSVIKNMILEWLD